MAAIVAIRYNPHVKALYERLLARGKSKMAALGAAMHKLVHFCFGVLKNRTSYQANDVKAAILILATSPCSRLRRRRWLEAFEHERHQVHPGVEAQVTGEGSDVTEQALA